ncbi:alpha/beta fold hydrolase [Neobacillus drentensis]|uniref:alpha/beta hydrolase n=1 Tax=Neobacillus drentensis TaxID=220684 RepID=UPI001F46425E|nr:alpha/beta fold hydrolase [Neobacillus drentensis]ULT57275.1 alpha/beta fold hydrolase [Neobacillus drentensis]
MIGCLLIHGFTGAPYEVEPLAEFLKERTDWKISVPTLPGHGVPGSLKGVHYQEWIDHAEAELTKLINTCDKVHVVGFSMGGMIASYLAAQYPVDKLILLSAAAYYVNPKQLAVDIKEIIKDSLRGKLQENELFLRYKRKITETPFAATLQFRRLVSFIKPLLHQVNVPTFIAQGECDGIVPPKSAEYLFHTISAKQKKLALFKHSKHLICHCEERDTLFSQVLDFLMEKRTI